MLNFKYMKIINTTKNYYITTCGKVFNDTKQLATFINNSGYECIKLHDGGKRRSYTIHRLVAQHFLSNPNNLREVNHINGLKTDNHMDNLEWVSSSENKLHALKTGLKVYNKPSTGCKLGTSSVYRHVSYDKRRNKWVANLTVNGKTKSKRFSTELEAAMYANVMIDLYQTKSVKNIFN